MEIATLPSGRRVGIRPVRADDGPRLQAAYHRLSELTKYRRFLTVKPRLTESDLRFLTSVDGSDHVALVATLVEHPERIIAVARFVRLPEDRRAAELAIVVGDQFQGQGIGTELLERLADRAIACGVERLTATVLADNLPIHRLLRHTSARERHLGSVDEVEVQLAA